MNVQDTKYFFVQKFTSRDQIKRFNFIRFYGFPFALARRISFLYHVFLSKSRASNSSQPSDAHPLDTSVHVWFR